MGMFQTRVRLYNLTDQDRCFSEDFWVDTGAIYSLAPAQRLEEIGVEASTQRRIVLADGREAIRQVGFCYFEVAGQEGRLPCPVIFGPNDSLYLLGATALENFGVDADPVSKTLKPIVAIVGGFLGSR